MSKNNWNPQPVKQQFAKLQLTDLIKINITNEFLQKVRYLCDNIRGNEWSGILFFEQEGTIKEPENMIITPKEILLMDIGNSTFTEYTFTKEVQLFIMKNKLMLCKYGHIHSHNTMTVFFSGEDDEELNRNCITHNYYLSLIVNNYMDMIAKVVFLAQPYTFLCPDEDGVQYSMPVEGLTKLMMVYDCNIQIEEVSVSDQFRDRLKEIRKRDEEARKLAAEEARVKAEQARLKMEAEKQTKALSVVPSSKKKEQPLKDTDKWESAPASKSNLVSNAITYDHEYFICYCLRNGEEVRDDIVEGALASANIGEAAHGYTVESIINNYATYYDNYYLVEERGLDVEHFCSATKEFISLCEEEMDNYPWLKQLGAGLIVLLNEFSKISLTTQN